MTAYYNEIDPYNVAWLKELISAGAIAPGDVDDRSIEDVTPNDLRGYVQCHFFAGIGVWSYALRQSGWTDDRPIWTGSCPCQPFSAAGKGKGFADERHLWPSFHWLIKQRRPEAVMGEQVASKDGVTWLDLVSDDMEGENYSVRAAVTAACGFGAPHIRKRIYWVADTNDSGLQRRARTERSFKFPVGKNGLVGSLADASSQQNNKEQLRSKINEREWSSDMHGRCGVAGSLADSEIMPQRTYSGAPGSSSEQSGPTGGLRVCSALANNDSQRLNRESISIRSEQRENIEASGSCKVHAPGPTNGHWKDVDWLFCRDGLWRPVESLSESLADGLADSLGYSSIEGRYSLNPLSLADRKETPRRIMRLKGYGNAIVAQQAMAFIESIMQG